MPRRYARSRKRTPYGGGPALEKLHPPTPLTCELGGLALGGELGAHAEKIFKNKKIPPRGYDKSTRAGAGRPRTQAADMIAEVIA